MQGAPADVVRMAMERGDPLSGTAGLAGELESGTLVRDVLGRYPLVTEAEDPTTYATDLTALSDLDLVPPGHRRDGDGDTRVWRLPDPAPFADDRRAVAAVRAAAADLPPALRRREKTAVHYGSDVPGNWTGWAAGRVSNAEWTTTSAGTSIRSPRESAGGRRRD